MPAECVRCVEDVRADEAPVPAELERGKQTSPGVVLDCGSVHLQHACELLGGQQLVASFGEEAKLSQVADRHNVMSDAIDQLAVAAT
jgi:hypothetical protein